MKTKIAYALIWDDRITLVISILIVAASVHIGALGLAITFGIFSVLAHVALLALSRSINQFESK